MWRFERRSTWPALALLASSVLLTACGMAPAIESRPGYQVDRRHIAPAQSSRIRHLVLHYTDSGDARSLKTLTGPRVSVHYLIPRHPENGHAAPRVYQLVDESRRAWHAGASRWRNRSNLNDTSIGIEIVNHGPVTTANGMRWDLFPPEQIEAVIAVARDIVARYGMDPTDVVAHADIAPQRKIDPGPRFPWARLHRAGIGAWPDPASVAAYRTRFEREPPTIDQWQRALAAYGYPVIASGELDGQTRAALRAFQMHFRPARYDGNPDAESAAILWALLAKYRPAALGRLRAD
ncbi:N-acetylmuramoyl-L-alanine amidase [Halomonas sp. HP20-15]|uniref:N-acetylmuramoyl-L-alanine amidase n=1 Tax=Halomonas sp. HP20-15 TaxID=3085901 RepID=UPI002980C0FC|nr:N-acetylmuramoyl-L-alanine amidase [Halomonas sp. HP20-15]MDW5375324.1 N-acetylmuramoyl-L-alanine amidase [Halomonas sp. HP20-15]